MTERVEKYFTEVVSRVDAVTKECYLRCQEEFLLATHEARKEAGMLGLDMVASAELAAKMVEERALFTLYAEITNETWREFFVRVQEETEDWTEAEALDLFQRMSRLTLQGNPYTME